MEALGDASSCASASRATYCEDSRPAATEPVVLEPVSWKDGHLHREMLDA